MSKLSEAFEKWARLQPQQNGSCCMHSHFNIDGDTPLPDDLVCDRERAWREYVRLRKGNAYWLPKANHPKCWNPRGEL
jgi:hypothetical protein